MMRHCRVVCRTDSDVWLVEREKVLTGSNAAAMLDLSPYQTKEELLAGNERAFSTDARRRMWWGSYLETANMKAFELWTGYKTRPCRLFLVHKVHPIGCSLDGLVSGYNPRKGERIIGVKPPKLPRGIFPIEMKNGNKHGWKDGELVDNSPKWMNAPPMHYQVQLQVQLLVTGKQFGVVCGKLGASEMRAHVVEADPLMHEELIEAAYEYQRRKR